MKAMVLDQAGPAEHEPLSWRAVPDPVPGPGQVTIKVSACGVCRSNLHMIEGAWLPATPTSFPIVPGHEVVGTVTEAGPGVTSAAPGDRVGIQPIWSTCGSCRYCLSGRDQLCRGRQITGETRDGGYAEQMLADAAHIYSIPDSLTDAETAPLLCPGITAYGAVKKAALSPGRSVAVIGAGGVGHMVIQLARLSGADVYAITRSKLHQEVAEEAGALRSCTPRDAGGSHLPDGSLDSAIVFAPAAEAVAEAIRVTRPGARIILGVAQPVGTVDIGDEKTIVGSVLGSRWEMTEVLGLAASGKIKPIHASYPLQEANKVLAQLKAGQIRGRAVLIP
jgi:alcohol dehydrogenase, propanol-preferring